MALDFSDEMRLLLDNIDTQIWYLVDEKTYGRVNRARAIFIGKAKSEIENTTLYDSYPAIIAEKCIEANKEVFKSKKQRHMEEWVVNYKGDNRLLMVIKTPKFDKDGNVEYVVCTANDVTDSYKQKKEIEDAHQELSRVHDELKETTAQIVHNERMEALGKLAAGVAHELNQPLNNIKIIVQDIQRDIRKERLDIDTLPESLDIELKQINRMAGIIDHMRVFTRRLDSMPKENFNINKPIEDMFLLMGEQLRLHNINAIVDLDHDLPKITGISIALEQAFTNIVSNSQSALEDFRKVGRIIEIKSYLYSEKEVAVSVKDNGGGIPEKIRKRIFEPFFTTKLPNKGTGLGLNLTKNIIKEHNGRILLDVVEDDSTTLTIILPIADEGEGEIKCQ